jgi:hypothetical protein
MTSWTINWQQLGSQSSRRYTCGHCGSPLASERGWQAHHPQAGTPVAWIYICHLCNNPTYFDPEKKQIPGCAFGDTVADIPDESVRILYDEARNATAAGCHTAAVLSCRKLLMHIAVAKGAAEGENFISYVEYLAAKNYVPPDAREWVDQIRAKGNEANHQIVIMSREDAEELISFSEMLLKLIYEFPAAVRRKSDAKSPAT